MCKGLIAEDNKASTVGGTYLFWGSLTFLIGLLVGLGAYYIHFEWLRQGAFVLIIFSVITLFLALKTDLNMKFHTPWISYGITLGILLVYLSLRIHLNRFDFGVGDASDYYVAGLCSVTYKQDIGFFLPLTASVSALGYSILGGNNAPWMNVILYSATIPIGYFIFRKLGIHVLVSLLVTIMLIFNPLSIWFSKTSFSEPIWQLLLLVYILVFYRMSGTSSLRIRDVFVLYLILFLAPFVRGEGVLYYGLVLFFALYHFWKYSSVKSSLLILVGMVVLTISIYTTLGIRAHYLLGWQYSHVIPNITKYELMLILSVFTVASMSLLGIIYFFKRFFSKNTFSSCCYTSGSFF